MQHNDNSIPRGASMKFRFSNILGVMLLMCVSVSLAAEVSQPRYGIRMDEQWIRMPDGIRLAAGRGRVR
jgi:hypothetical protein